MPHSHQMQFKQQILRCMAAFKNNNTALINTNSQKITNDLANATDSLKYTINKVVNSKKYYDIVIRI